MKGLNLYFLTTFIFQMHLSLLLFLLLKKMLLHVWGWEVRRRWIPLLEMAMVFSLFYPPLLSLIFLLLYLSMYIFSYVRKSLPPNVFVFYLFFFLWSDFCLLLLNFWRVASILLDFRFAVPYLVNCKALGWKARLKQEV